MIKNKTENICIDVDKRSFNIYLDKKKKKSIKRSIYNQK